jgi:hypothetical protein
MMKIPDLWKWIKRNRKDFAQAVCEKQIYGVIVFYLMWCDSIHILEGFGFVVHAQGNK